MVNTEVIIVGGGLNGLASAVLLAHHGVRCVVIERHPATSIQYKFAGISPRSMEIFRSVGLEAEIRAKRTGDQQGGGLGRGKNLADPDLQWSEAAWPDASGVSPTQPATCDQHVLEPILEARARALGADVRFDTEFIALEKHAAGVRAHVRSRASGREEIVEGAWLIAADGASGSVRDLLGIGRSGAGVLQHWMNVIFETDMPATLDGRRFTSCFVMDINGTFTPREGGRWLLSLQYSPANGEKPADFDAERVRALVRRGAGDENVRADLVDARPWDVAACIADSFRSGRCFIVGDAAHLMPPTGAFGGNTGIHDAHNLAWKLAHVLRRGADVRLLDSYDAERRPLVDATLDQALARLKQWFKDPAGRIPNTVPIVPDYDVVLGQRYRAGAFVAAGEADGWSFTAHQSLSGSPGTRAPHRWIEVDGRKISTLDHFDCDCVLIVARGSAWRFAARPLTSSPFGLRVVELDDVSPFDIEKGGAVLVRPDGIVAWRSQGADPEAPVTLASVVRSLGLGSQEAS